MSISKTMFKASTRQQKRINAAYRAAEAGVGDGHKAIVDLTEDTIGDLDETGKNMVATIIELSNMVDLLAKRVDLLKATCKSKDEQIKGMDEYIDDLQATLEEKQARIDLLELGRLVKTCRINDLLDN